MPLYLLGTDHISLHQRGNPSVTDHVRNVPERELAASIVSYEEQLRGWLDVIRKVEQTPKLPLAYQSLREMQLYFCRLQLIDFNVQTEQIYHELRKEYRRLGSMDLRIAASAMATNAILVTRNQRDFSQIAGLILEDWTSS